MIDKNKDIQENQKLRDIADLPVTRIIIVFVFAIFFGTLLYAIINEFFTNQ